MFALGAIPTIIQCIGMSFLPESPVGYQTNKKLNSPNYKVVIFISLVVLYFI